MYEADGSAGSSLHPETLRRIREVFAGRTCSVCGAAAVRLYAGRFVCLAHYPKTPRNLRPPRVYHYRIPVGA